MKMYYSLLMLFISITASAQDEIRRNFIKIGEDVNWGASIYEGPGVIYERVIGQKNSFNVGVHYIATTKLNDDAIGKDLETKLRGVLLDISYRRYFTQDKPAPNGVFIEPGVAATYMSAKTSYVKYYGPVSSVTYTSNYSTVTPFLNIGYQLLLFEKLVAGFKINMGYMIPVYKNERRPPGTTFELVQSKFLVGFGVAIGFGLY